MSWRSERMETLLVDEATGNLSVDETRELDALLSEDPEIDRYAFERVASAVFLAGSAQLDAAMPDELIRKLIAAGEKLVAEAD